MQTYIKLPIENPNINDVDKIFYAYLTEHNRKYDHYLVECSFK